MKNRLTQIFIGTFTSLLILLPAVPVSAGFFDNARDQACSGANATSGSACDKTASSSLSNIIAVMLNIFSVVVGVIAVIMIIVAGVKFVTSGGAADKVSGAKNTILYAVIGLAVVALAQIIVRFVLNKVG